jgi:aminopeptidase N
MNIFQLTAFAAFATTTAATSVTSTTATRSSPIEYFRSDYRPSDFLISDIYLSFQLDASDTTVVAVSKVSRSPTGTVASDLILDGEELNLVSIKIAGKTLGDEEFSYADGKLTIFAKSLPQSSGDFEVETTVKLNPDKNLALSGLYKSGSNLLCTQCEAMGFRRIAFHQGKCMPFFHSLFP